MSRFIIIFALLVEATLMAQPVLPAPAPWTNWPPSWIATTNPGPKTNITIACDPYMPAFGNSHQMLVTAYRNGVFYAQHAYPGTNVFKIWDLDATAQWTFTVTALIYVSPPSNQATFVCSNLAPFVTVSNGLSTLSWWGAGNSNYQIFSGPSPGMLSNAGLPPFSGSNGVLTFSEPIQPARFYALKATP